MNLYEIDTEIRLLTQELEAWAEEHNGDVTGCPAMDAIDGLTLDRERKVLSLACLIREKEAEAEATKVEIARLKARYDARTRQVERMEEWLQSNIRPGEKFKDARVTVTLRESKATVVDVPTEELPDCFIRSKVIVEPDKKAIGEALKAGELVPGCHLETRWNLSIK